jgi:phosphatidylinositol-3-phosphatase
MGSMRVLVVLAAVAVGIATTSSGAGAGSEAERDNVSLPARAAFVYPWYPETWRVGGEFPHFAPAFGRYNSSSRSVVDRQIRALDYGRVKVAIASWWGPGTHAEATRIPLLLARTRALRSPLRWALYYEREGTSDPSVSMIRADLAYAARYAASPAYARLHGKPVIFVYNANDTSCSVVDRWHRAAGSRWYVVMKVFPGYHDCATQPASWHEYAPAQAEVAQPGYSFSISPGFWKADESKPRLERSIARWSREVRDMTASKAPWQLITTFNEWGEGTAVEPARQWRTRSGFGAYLDVLHGPPAVPTPGNPPPTATATTTTPVAPPSTGAPCTGAAPKPVTNVIWIWMENHSYDGIVGNGSAPFLNRLAEQCGLATNYFGIAHPSLPNYIAATSGDTQGIHDDSRPSAHPLSAPSIFGQTTAAGLGWRSYQEDMPANCALTDSGRYAVKHNPAAYFTGIRGDCSSRDVPLGTPSGGAFVSDLRNDKLPGFSFVTPNLCNDMHDCGVGTGDSWLSTWIPLILTSPAYRSGRTVVFLTWDESDGGSNHVATVVVSPSTPSGTRAADRFDHYSLLKTTEQLLGLTTYLGHAADASTSSMRNAFHL